MKKHHQHYGISLDPYNEHKSSYMGLPAHHDFVLLYVKLASPAVLGSKYVLFTLGRLELLLI